MYRPSGDMATLPALPLSVSLVICMFCRLRLRGSVNNLNAPYTPATTRNIRAAATGFLERPRLAGAAAAPEPDCAEAPSGDPVRSAAEPAPLATPTRPELLSRFSRFKSARRSAAL